MSSVDETFDALGAIKRVKAFRKECQRKRYSKSRLDKYRAELVEMRRVGASCADLVVWLRLNHRLLVNRSTVDRFLKRLQEFGGDGKQVAELVMPLEEL